MQTDHTEDDRDHKNTAILTNSGGTEENTATNNKLYMARVAHCMQQDDYPPANKMRRESLCRGEGVALAIRGSCRTGVTLVRTLAAVLHKTPTSGLQGHASASRSNMEGHCGNDNILQQAIAATATARKANPLYLPPISYCLRVYIKFAVIRRFLRMITRTCADPKGYRNRRG